MVIGGTIHPFYTLHYSAFVDISKTYIDSQVNSALRRSSSLSGLNAAISFKIESGRMQVEETHKLGGYPINSVPH